MFTGRFSRGTYEIPIRPLFYDALSGEFVPPSDKLGRSHTLARLAVAASQKGEYNLRSLRSEHAPSSLKIQETEFYTYSPSWADVLVRIVRRRITQTNPLNPGNVEGILLGSQNTANSLEVYEVTPYDRPEQRRIRIVGSEVLELPLNLAEIEAAREAVTRSTQEFFDSVV